MTGVLVNLHHSEGVGGCGLINIDAIQQVVAAKWAIDVINNQSLPHELQIGEYTIITRGRSATKILEKMCLKNLEF